MLLQGRQVFAAVALIGALGASAAHAEESVEVVSEVVLASNDGNAVEPKKLSQLKDDLAKMGVAYSSYRRLSEEKLSLQTTKPAEVKLDGGRTATLKLVELKDNVATVNVTVNAPGHAKPLVDTRYRLGRKPVTIGPIDHERGKLILILSPPGAARPHRAVGVQRPVRPNVRAD